MNYKDLESIILRLSKKRPVFHSEDDFKFSLSQEILKKIPKAEIRLERPFGKKFNKYLDLLVKIGNDIYPIELKHLTERLNPEAIEVYGETFRLKKHGAIDLGANGCLKDVQRIEELSKSSDFKTGYTIWLTNDSSYWREPRIKTANYVPFSIHDGAVKHGKMACDAGILKSEAVNLNGRYVITWKPYSNLGEGVKNGVFKYALLEIKATGIKDRMNDKWYEDPTEEELAESIKILEQAAEKIARATRRD